MKCRHCASSNLLGFADLGSAPPSNAYLSHEDLSKPEQWFPLKVFTCQNCWLVQTEDFASFDELFDENYAYFSSYSQSWLEHSEAFVGMAQARFGLNPDSMVVEAAANDGYLLQFVNQRGIPCYGIEPTRSTADAARAKGIEIVQEFLGTDLARQLAETGRAADLTIANNVLAHVPDIVDFAASFTHLLKPDGVACFEFPHLLNLIRFNQFDTIYHEHFSYLSLTAVRNVFETAGLKIFDVEKISTHGGSLRVYAQRSDTGSRPVEARYQNLLDEEAEAGISSPQLYSRFQGVTETIKNDFLSFLVDAAGKGKKVCGYGAAAKGNTLLNFAGVRPDLIAFVVDNNPAKQGRFMPGSRIPIVDEAALDSFNPDYVVIFPWNLRDEIASRLEPHCRRGAKIVTAIPEMKIS